MKAWYWLSYIVSCELMLARLAVFSSGVSELIVNTPMFRAGVADIVMDAGFTPSFFFDFLIKGSFAVKPVFNHLGLISIAGS